MKRILLISLLLSCVCLSAFCSGTYLNFGVNPYGFQRSYFFWPDENFMDSKYALGLEAGITYNPAGAFVVSSDVIFTDYMYGYEVNEQILTASLRLGFQSQPKKNLGVMLELGIGGSLYHFEKISRLYLEVPLQVGAFYSLDGGSRFFLKARGDVALLFSKEFRTSSLSLMITPVLGYSLSI